MKTLKILLLLVFYFSISCSQNNNLLRSKDLKLFFSDTEINDFNTILTFFDSIVKKTTNIKNTNNAYKEYLKELKVEYSRREIEIGISQKDNLFLFQHIDENTISEIWVKINTKDRDGIEKKALDLKNGSNYQQFLKYYSDKEPFIKEYYNLYFNTGCMNAGVISYVINNSTKLDFRNNKIRLILAIHFITLNTHNNNI